MRKVCLVLALVALVSLPAMAQMFEFMDFNIMGAGARAHGMGGAFIGVADDATAVSWNPAGIAQLEKMEGSVVGLFNMKKYTDEWTIGGVSDSWEGEDKHIAPTFASFSIPLSVGARNLVMAIAYQRMIDMGSTSQDEGTDIYGDYTYEDKVTGGIDAITPAIAFQVSPKFSLGLAGNIMVNGFEEQFDKTYPLLNNSTDSYTHEYKTSGFHLNAGALFKSKSYNIGASFRFPFEMTQEYTLTNDWDFTPNGGNSGSVTDPTVETKTSMPLMMGFGLAFKPSDNFTLAADYEIRKYSDAETEYEAGGVTYTEKLGWNDCNQFRVGMEYIFVGSNAVFPVRLGFRTDPKVYDGFKGSFTDPDTAQAVGMVFTGGFGLIMGKVVFDLAYEYGTTKIWDIDDATWQWEETLVEKNSNIMASCIFHF